MTKRILLALLLATLITACSSSTVATTSETQTATTAPTTTVTNPPLVNGGLIPVDPATLIPLKGAEPILVADWFSGVTSPNGQFAAIENLEVASETLRIALVEISSNTVLANVEVSAGVASGLSITDEGVVYWLGNGPGLTLYRLGGGTDQAEVFFDEFPADFTSVSLNPLPDGRFGVFGTTFEQQAEGVGMVVLVAADASGHVEIRLENVITGFANEPDPETAIPVFKFAGNAPVWDNDGDRFLLVEAARDVVTEVDLSTTEVSEHPFSVPLALVDQLWTLLTPAARAKGPAAGIARDAILTPDGQSLYVATSITDTEVEGAEWETVKSPQDLLVLDTDSWHATSLEIPVDMLSASPDNTHLLAHGADVTEGTGVGFEVRPSPVYVIDMASMEVLLGFQTSDDSAAELQFSENGDLGYISTWSEGAVTIDILDLGLLQLTGSVSFRELSLIGQAGYMAFHLE